MVKNNLDDEFKGLQLFVQELYGDPKSHKSIIPEKLQNDELEKLKIGRRRETFYFIVDFLRLEITEANGLDEMGFQEAHFDFKYYISILPEGAMRQLLFLLGKQTFKMAEKTFIGFMKPKFVALVPLKNSDGEMMLCKRTISVWQMSEEGKILSYLSEFTIIKPFENEAALPRFYDVDPKLRDVFDGLVKKIFNHLPAKENPFTHREIILLNLYIENPEKPFTAKQIAEKENLSIATVHSYNKNILTKARRFFNDNSIKSASDVAILMKKNGILS
ncbi:helix-turn-helix transcriptional regulator [Arcticibacterium luteifluviistationis]|uniref:HTH luxR-type domain-containing protein n=1 Tax=Arcticibacterium luteifluviistationis TaxID=1784714 RepID=A0A2Z4GA34_9BACT|nr:response regulator transcription factor [Arcticibacterium luteifluviistationis]AWV98056.1 hypothetical protein DJ013_07675 [Arcticibacterium luteifluviistationis]